MPKQQPSTDHTSTIVVAILSVIGALGAAYFTYRGMTDPAKISLSATQTAEAKLLVKMELPDSPIAPMQMLAPTETMTPAIPPTLTLTPMPLAIVDTSALGGWVPDFNSSKADKEKNKIDVFENAINLSYEVGADGFVVITKGLDAEKLLGTEGISFIYNGTGKYNTLEFKLLVRYPEYTSDTIYGIIWRRETNTNGKWIKKEVRYSDIWCWGSSQDCIDHPEVDITKVDRLDFAVSNKPGDDPGSGWILIKDVFGIRP